MVTGVIHLAWTQPVELQGSRVTSDPLGVRAWANSVAAALVPGLSNRNNRLQAFGLLCAGLKVAGSTGAAAAEVGARELWLRLERLWVLAQLAREDDGADLGWPGIRQARLILSRHNDRDSLTEPLLGAQLAAGIWGGYRRAATTFGLCAGAGTTPAGFALTSTGRGVAEVWIKKMIPGYTTKQLMTALVAGVVPRDDLQRVEPDLGPSPRLAALISAALLATAYPGREYLALYRLWQAANRAAGDLRPQDLDPSHLTDKQRPYVPSALTVEWLYNHIEQPYRQHIAGYGSRPPTRATWADPAWDVVAAYRPQLLRLQQLGSATPRSWDGVVAWVEALASSRSAEPITGDNAPASFASATPPPMSLTAVSALFDDGLLDTQALGRADSGRSRD